MINSKINVLFVHFVLSVEGVRNVMYMVLFVKPFYADLYISKRLGPEVTGI